MASAEEDLAALEIDQRELRRLDPEGAACAPRSDAGTQDPESVVERITVAVELDGESGHIPLVFEVGATSASASVARESVEGMGHDVRGKAVAQDWQQSGVFWGVFVSETAVGVFTLWLFTRGSWKKVQV